MALNSVGQPTYQDIFDSLQAEVDTREVRNQMQTGVIKAWALDAMRILTERVPVRDQYELLMVPAQEDYSFEDTDLPVTGSGRVSASDINLVGDSVVGTGTVACQAGTVTVRGTGTKFATEFVPGKTLIFGGEEHEVLEVHSDLELVLEVGFSIDIPAGSAFSISTTNFRREIVVGSVLTVAAQSLVVKSITNSRTAVLVSPPGVAIVSATYTVDTCVMKIPTKFHRIVTFDRLEFNFRRSVKLCDIKTLFARRIKDYAYTYTSYSRPLLIAPWEQNGKRYLKVYPKVETAKSVTIYGEIKIKPRFYADAPMDSPIPLGDEYEPVIRHYLKAMCYKTYKDDDRNYGIHMKAFEAAIASFAADVHTPTVLEVAYK